MILVNLFAIRERQDSSHKDKHERGLIGAVGRSIFLGPTNLNVLCHQVEASAIRSMERNARIFQKRYEERAVSDAEAACGASW